MASGHDYNLAYAIMELLGAGNDALVATDVAGKIKAWRKEHAATAEGELAALRALLTGPMAPAIRAEAFAEVERELRKHQLSVCKCEPGNGDWRAGHYTPVWEGEEQDGWSLLQAVDELREETP